MNVLVACEFSATVRDAFRAWGHNAWSCDLLPCEKGDEYHYQCDALEAAKLGCPMGLSQTVKKPWDIMIAHPPCTHLAVSGARWWKDKFAEQQDAVTFFLQLAACAWIPRIAIENPIGLMSTRYRKPDQIIQPWQFGNGETKATCLWLKNLPKLVPTNIVDGREARVHRMPPGPNRWKERSRTYQGIADAMAVQWGIIRTQDQVNEKAEMERLSWLLQ
jgi:hypothetical protein